MQWAVGVTTVAGREFLLKQTMDGLHNSGFREMRVFGDAHRRHYALEERSVEHYTLRYPRIGAFGNWYLALTELYIRNPGADRFAIFQDDILVCQNLRQYLEKTTSESPTGIYWNLTTYDANIVDGESGWIRATRKGLGAQGLAFTPMTVQTLLMSPDFVLKPHGSNPTQGIDGAVYEALSNLGYGEMIHHPGLIGHVPGPTSISGPHPHVPCTLSFPGVEYDPLKMATV